MNVDELTSLLARIQVLDNRQVDQITIEAWTPLMRDVPYPAAVDAVNEHFRSSTDYLQPAHIVQYATTLRRRRFEVTMSPEVPDTCPDGSHRRLPDGTCLFCTDRETRA